MEKKFNKAYGEMFSLLREQREFNVTDFNKVGLSSSTLSRFENGENCLRYDILDAALGLMGIDIGEFEYFCNEFHLDYRVEICQRIEEANYAQDLETIRQIHDEAAEYHFRLIELATKNLLEGLTKDEQEELRNQFFIITEWSYYELCILAFTVEVIGNNVEHSLLRDFWNKNFHYMNVPKYREKVFQIACRAAFGHIKNDEAKEAKRIITRVKKRREPRDLFPNYNTLFVEGAWEYRFGNKLSGIKEMELVANSFRVFHQPEMAVYFEKRQKEIEKNT
ncbi:MAG: XRE family transcriptional regulator [Streptococcaceae bacterium]|jgi:Rgg/GadR/MutR family transcriptional activator|nr:XRE family transcriptional regulator [Streptococcaceae bacterium]